MAIASSFPEKEIKQSEHMLKWVLCRAVIDKDFHYRYIEAKYREIPVIDKQPTQHTMLIVSCVKGHVRGHGSLQCLISQILQ